MTVDTTAEGVGLIDPFVPRVLQGVRGADGPGRWQAEGTLVVADLSGFTRLTDKLSRRGRAGAEEIATTVSQVFTALLSAVDPAGDVLKLSGDALVIFFQAPDHALRACHTALAMQRVLREVGGIDSSRGRVRLRMSVGVHTGAFEFLLCGDAHLELAVVGPAASRTVQAQTEAGPGQVLISPEVVPALGAAARMVETEVGAVLRSLSGPAPGPGPEADESQAGIGAGVERFLPPLLRGHLPATRDEHEHRRATVGFVRCGGLDELAASPAELFGRLQTLTCLLMDACTEHGVLLVSTDLTVDGATHMLASGVPTTNGEDEVRLLRVARQVVETDVGLPVRFGAAVGGVFAGAVGARSRRTYTAMGDTTNVAARLSAQAPPGEVLVTGELAAAVRGRFVIEAVPALSLKGKRAPITGARILHVVALEPDHETGSVPLIGREAELDVLLEALEAARAGGGRVVEVIGDRGTGKSRLVAELRAHSHGMSWLAAACEPYDAHVPFHGARALLRRIIGLPIQATAEETGRALRRLAAERAPALVPLLPLLATPADADLPATDESRQVATRFRSMRAAEVAGDLVAALAAEPAVLVIEGIEHMDPASAEIVEVLLRRNLPDNAWLVVLTGEPTGSRLRHTGQRVMLEPLDRHHTVLLAAELADRTPVPVHLLTRLVELSAGNPLLLNELVAAHAQEGISELTPEVESVIAARIDALAPADRRVLRYAAVLGQQFDAGLMDATLGDLAVHSSRRELWDRLGSFITHTEEGFAFRNELARQVAYEALPVAVRRDLHGRVADALSAHAAASPSRLALHLSRAERWREAWEAAVEAGHQTRQAGANASAGELYDLALEAARHSDPAPSELAAVATAAGDAHALAGLYGQAARAYLVATRVLDDPAERLSLEARRGEVEVARGRTVTALRRYGRAMREAASLPAGADRQRCVARLHVAYAAARLRQGRSEACLRHCEEAIAAVGDHDDESLDDEILARALHLLDAAHSVRGEHEAAARARDRALPVHVRLGDLSAQGTVLADLAGDAYREGRLEEAGWLYERGREARGRAGDVVGEALTACGLAAVLRDQDRLEEARDLLLEARRTLSGAGDARGVAAAERDLGTVALRSGDTDDAARRLQAAVDGFGSLGATGEQAGAQRLLAEALTAEQRWVEAWEAVRESLEHTPDPSVAHRVAAGRIRGQALLRTGSRERGLRELREARELADQHHEKAERAAIRRLLEDIGQAAGST